MSINNGLNSMFQNMYNFNKALNTKGSKRTDEQKELINQADLNGDGKLSEEEKNAQYAKLLGDQTGDGKVDSKDWKAYSEMITQIKKGEIEVQANIDLNGDGTVDEKDNKALKKWVTNSSSSIIKTATKTARSFSTDEATGATTTTTYKGKTNNAASTVVKNTDGTSTTTNNTYNSKGVITSSVSTVNDASGKEVSKTTITYDEKGTPIKQTVVEKDVNGNKMTTKCDFVQDVDMTTGEAKGEPYPDLANRKVVKTIGAATYTVQYEDGELSSIKCKATGKKIDSIDDETLAAVLATSDSDGSEIFATSTDLPEKAIDAGAVCSVTSPSYKFIDSTGFEWDVIGGTRYYDADGNIVKPSSNIIIEDPIEVSRGDLTDIAGSNKTGINTDDIPEKDGIDPEDTTVYTPGESDSDDTKRLEHPVEETTVDLTDIAGSNKTTDADTQFTMPENARTTNLPDAAVKAGAVYAIDTPGYTYTDENGMEWSVGPTSEYYDANGNKITNEMMEPYRQVFNPEEELARRINSSLNSGNKYMEAKLNTTLDMTSTKKGIL